ncbi:glycerophosphodiester phosphodiesterase family protein [Hoeflea prorocentri]|uniref:Glycerophosphodiester phosphodiesterase family protein n=1 Tax=Hoeflea prorocentri TaxID=1922333 RepID=A0A9X3UIF4_9HYPH|nr:glycerophosphodiester phosphodiesterase family protein [Hoeflea prorocentri]MCY6381400.1 glycerophosphodiester phosphodiesterase family protein [Hoeflea prorocentri]MDA5399200.1 glycerophosphodiester phosphodiesterase family protein [Hoeflea prorocentri]
MPSDRPIVDQPVLAHRGASAFAPENTLRAVELAAEMGAKWIETDVQITADGGLVIIHDLELDRTTSGNGFVGLTPTDHIRSLDAGSWFDPSFCNCRVPTLEEFLACILDNDLSLQLELKDLPGREYELADAVCALLREYWPFGENGLFISGFSPRCLMRAKQNLPDVPGAIALVCVPDDPDGYARDVGASIIHVQDCFVDDAALERIRRSSVEFAVATVNDPDRANYLIDSGVQSVLTDDPMVLQRGNMDTTTQAVAR